MIQDVWMPRPNCDTTCRRGNLKILRQEQLLMQEIYQKNVSRISHNNGPIDLQLSVDMRLRFEKKSGKRLTDKQFDMLQERIVEVVTKRLISYNAKQMIQTQKAMGALKSCLVSCRS